MNPGDLMALMSVVICLTVGGVLIFRGPIGKALGRRIEGRGAAEPELNQRIDELEQRLSEMEHDRTRVGELEERLDFAERLLAAGPERLKDEGR